MSKSQNALVVARRSDLNPTFQRQVQLLAEESADLAKSYSDLTTRMLRFAQQFRALWERSRALDSDQSNPKHEEYLHAVLEDAVKSQNRSIWSQWNTIGAHAAELLTYKSALPPQRDSLYEMALAVKERRPIKAWVRGEKITSESTVREVKLLRKKRTHKKRHKSHLATVTLKKRISFKREMRDLRSLLHAPTDMYLRTDDKTYKRNVLGRGSPGSTHTYWSRTQMWKMKTRFGDLSEQVLKRDRRLISKLEKLFDPTVTNKRNFRKSAESAVRTALKFLEFDKGSGTAFPPFHARYLADRYLPQDGDGIVIDPCAGWGGRLLGTLCVPRTGHVRYYGVDPEKRNQRAYEGLTRRVQIWLKGEVAGKRTAHVFSKPFEDWVLSPTAKRLYGQVDLVMTSPPYFSAENYNPKSKMQSANRYPEYELWREGFYRKLVEGAFNLLKPNGIFVLNIAVVAGAPRLERDARALAKDVGFKREEFFKLAMSVRPEGSRHVVCVEGASFKYEPVFVFRKPVIKTIACNNREERIRHGAIL